MRPGSALRSLRATMLFGRVFFSYALQWLAWRIGGARSADARWQRVHALNARRLADGFVRMGGVFIKLGQVVSVLGGFLPEAYRRELERLQDAVPPRPFEEVRRRLVEALGPNALEQFRDFDEEALAAASLAQVHRATTRDGRAVVVKVLYPGVERLIAADLRVLRVVLRILHGAVGFQRMGTIIDQLTSMLDHEMDYTHEYANVELLRSLLGSKPNVVIPDVIEALSRRQVLTLSFEPGIRVTDLAAMNEAGIDPTAIADLLVDVYVTTLLEHHVLHADPHPGNFLAREGNQLVILDFGAVEHIPESLVAGLKRVMLGGLASDANQVLAGIDEMGFVSDDGNREVLEQAGREYLSTLSQITIGDFSRISPQQLRQLSGFEQLRGRLRAITSSLRYPPGYFYVERTLVLLFGLLGQIVPSRGLLGVAAPHAARALMRQKRAP